MTPRTIPIDRDGDELVLQLSGGRPWARRLLPAAVLAFATGVGSGIVAAIMSVPFGEPMLFAVPFVVLPYVVLLPYANASRRPTQTTVRISKRGARIGHDSSTRDVERTERGIRIGQRVVPAEDHPSKELDWVVATAIDTADPELVAMPPPRMKPTHDGMRLLLVDGRPEAAEQAAIAFFFAMMTIPPIAAIGYAVGDLAFGTPLLGLVSLVLFVLPVIERVQGFGPHSEVVLTASTLQIGRRRWNLTDIRRIEVEIGALIIDGERIGAKATPAGTLCWIRDTVRKHRKALRGGAREIPPELRALRQTE